MSLAAYKLYKQQYEINGGKSDDNSLYQKFIGENKSAVAFGWLNPADAGKGTDPGRRTTPTPDSSGLDSQGNYTGNTSNSDPERTNIRNRTALVTSSFDQALELLYKEIITEEEPQTAPPATEENTAPTKKPFETSPGSNLYIYNYNTLKEAANTFKLQEAINLLQQLQSFADYVKVKEGQGRGAALSKIAGAVDLGVKMF